MSEFKQFKRSAIAEMRPVNEQDIKEFEIFKNISPEKGIRPREDYKVSISSEDLNAGSPKIGDMIARNPKNHNDQWLVTEQYFKDNFI